MRRVYTISHGNIRCGAAGSIADQRRLVPHPQTLGDDLNVGVTDFEQTLPSQLAPVALRKRQSVSDTSDGQSSDRQKVEPSSERHPSITPTHARAERGRAT